MGPTTVRTSHVRRTIEWQAVGAPSCLCVADPSGGHEEDLLFAVLQIRIYALQVHVRTLSWG
jgi:hypothetical protein